MKYLIAKRHKNGAGIDIGWRGYDQEYKPFEIYWGNTRDGKSLSALIADAYRQGYVFEVDDSASVFLPPLKMPSK